MVSDLQKATAQAIVNIFETGRVHGDYAKVTLLAGDPGHLTYGRSQTTLASGGLHLLINAYCEAPAAELAAPLRDYLERLVPFSRKGRGFCPSCGGRRNVGSRNRLRMLDTPAVRRRYLRALPVDKLTPCFRIVISPGRRKEELWTMEARRAVRGNQRSSFGSS